MLFPHAWHDTGVPPPNQGLREVEVSSTSTCFHQQPEVNYVGRFLNDDLPCRVTPVG